MINFLTCATLQRKTNTGTHFKSSISKKAIGLLVGLVMVVGWGGESWGQVSITTLPQTYTQSFDAALGTSSLTWTNNTTVAGWYISSASPLAVNTGTINSNACYNFGVAGTNPITDRALGAISNATTHRFGLRMANNSGSSITSFNVSFTGEQWRSFNAGTLVFEYQTGTTVTSLTAGTWTALSTLDFASLATSGGAALDGNNSSYRTAKSATLTVTVATGTEIFFRWTKAGTSSPGLAIDDLSITAVSAACSAPTLTGASQASAVCAGSAASINLTGMVASTSGNAIDYTINGVAQTQITGINSDASGNANITTSALTLANNGQILQITKITNSSCSTSFTRNITLAVNAIPATPTAGSNSPICAGATLNLTSNATGTIAWTGPGSYTAAVQNPTISNATSATVGTYSVTSTVNGCTSTAGTTTVSVTTPAITGASTVSISATTTLAGTPAGGTWSSASTSYVTIDASTGVATGVAAGSSLITYTVNGCSATTTVTASASSACYSENFSGFTLAGGSTDLSSTLDSKMQTTGWAGLKVFEEIGYAKLGSSSALGYLTTPILNLSTATSISIDILKYGSDPGTVQVLLSTNGGSTYTQIGSDITPTSSWATTNIAISGGNSNSKIKITTSSVRAYIDNISITCTSGPTITVGSITAFGSVCTGSASAEKTYNVSGSSLTGNLVITAPAGFQISTTSGSGFGSSVTLIPSSGNVASTPIYVIFVPALVQAYSGLNITHVSTGASTQNVSVAGDGVNNLPPAINTPVSSGITTTTAVLGGTITAIGCSNITERGIYWSLTAGFADGAGTKVSETPGPYNIGAFTVAVSGLPSGTTIYFKAFALSASGTVYTSQASFITLKAEPTNQVTAFSCGATTSNSIPLTWTPAVAGTQAPDGYLILWSTGAISAPVDGVSQADGAGVYNVTSAATAVYNAGGLSSNTTYNFQIWSYTNSGTSINYKLAAAPVTSCTTTAGPCLSEGFGGYSTGTRPSGWAFTGLANAEVYTSAPYFGTASPSLKMGNTGDQIVTASVSNASQLEFWIYGNGTPTTDKLLVEGWDGAAWQTIDNVTPPTSSGLTKTYNSGSSPALASGFSQFRFTYTRVSINLGFDDVSISCITCTPPTTQATNFSTNAITENSMNIAFNRGNGDGGVIVVARAGTAPTDPASGFSYTANAAFGNGSACGSGFVVYNGVANGINAATGNIAITNLAPSTTYYFAVYEYNALDDCYNLIELSANATTLNVTATRLLFNIQPSTTGINQTMSPNVKVLAVDANGVVDVTFSGTITLTSTGTMTGPVTVAAVNGIATFPSIVHTVLGTSLTLTAGYPSWTSVVSTTFDIVQSTTFKPGDLIFIGYDGVMVPTQMTDKIYILNMVPINPGTKFQFVNSRFEAGAAAGVRTMKWCGGSDDPNTLPAVIDITYNGSSSIAAGSIISFTIDYTTPIAYWVNNVVSTDFAATGASANITGTSGDGDQLWLTQGTFSDYTTYSLFSGAVLYGMTITTPWVPLTDACSAGTTGGATRESRLHPDLECFNLAVGNYKYGFYKNIALHTGSKRDILVAIMGITNWKFGTGTDALDVTEDYDTPWDDPSGTGVSLGKPFTITSASTAPDGTWVGDNTTFPNDWFYCGNWQGLAVPDQNDDVYIPSNATSFCDVNYSSVHAPNFSYIAKCKNLKIEGSSGNYYLSLKGDADDKLEVYGNLTINGNGLLDMQGGSVVDGEISLMGDWINNRGTSGFLPGKGSIKMTGSIPQNISSSSLLENFSHLTIINSSTGVTLINDCVVSDLLTLTLGKVHTGINYMKVTSTDVNSIAGHNTDRSLANYTSSSYINGNLKRSVAATGSYDFPVGAPSWYELATVNLNASSGLFFITASFKTPVDGNAPNVTVNGSLISSLLNAGYWIITPDALTSVNYDVTASSTGHNNGGGSAAQYTLLKRISSLNDWASLGTHSNTTQTIYGSGATEVITAKRSAYTGFSHFGIGKGSDGPLPVELTTFNAECNPLEMLVSWSTATETNNDYFTLERSSDAQHFEKIAEVRGAGNSNMPINYSFTDAAPLEGIAYYRLIQNDYDGNSETFGPVAARCDGALNSDFQIVNVTNDGVNPQITYYISTNEKVNLCVYDINGRCILCAEQTGDAGNRQLNLDLKAGAGLYFISLTDGDKILSTRVFIR